MNKLKISSNKILWVILWVIVVLLVLASLQSLSRISDLENTVSSLEKESDRFAYKDSVEDNDSLRAIKGSIADLEHDLCRISEYLQDKDSGLFGLWSPLNPKRIACN